MIKSRMADTSGNIVFFLGIDEENVRRLKAGMPIKVYLRELGGNQNECVIIHYGKNLGVLKEDIRDAVNFNGGNLP